MDPSSIKTYRLINSSGCLVRELKCPVAEIGIDIRDLPQGIYLLVLSAEDGSLSRHKVVFL